MRKLLLMSLFITYSGYAQIDYKGLVKNLDEVTKTTDLKVYFKGLPVDISDSDLEYRDERFLRFYGVIVDEVSFSERWTGNREMEIKLFNEKTEVDKIKAKLIALYGEPEVNEYDDAIRYEWITDEKNIVLTINLEKGQFKDVEDFTISFNQD